MSRTWKNIITGADEYNIGMDSCCVSAIHCSDVVYDVTGMITCWFVQKLNYEEYN